MCNEMHRTVSKRGGIGYALALRGITRSVVSLLALLLNDSMVSLTCSKSILPTWPRTSASQLTAKSIITSSSKRTNGEDVVFRKSKSLVVGIRRKIAAEG